MKSFSEFIIEAAKKAKKPKILERLINQLKDKGFSIGAASAIATKTQQKAGNLKPGSNKLTKKGKKRQKMGAAGRAKDRAAKRSGKSTKSYKYNARTNQATLRENVLMEVHHIFADFDGTLADDHSKVKVGDRSMSGVEFSSYVPHPNDPKPDFSEFSRLNKPTTTDKHFSFNVFKGAASKLAKKKAAGATDLPVVSIVTARPRAAEPHIRQWLKDNGIHNAEDIHIHAVQSSDPADKVTAIRTHITAGRIKSGDKIHFFDDHAPNVDAIANMQGDHKDIKIRSVHVGDHRRMKPTEVKQEPIGLPDKSLFTKGK